MNELTIINRDGKLLADSREIADRVGRQHNELLKSIRQYCEYLTAGDFALSDFFIESDYKDSTGRTLPRYLITRKGCDMVANKMTGPKGVLFTAEYVTEFDRMEKQLQQPQLPQDYLSALKALVSSEEEKQMLSAKVQQDAPKVLFADSVAGSHNSILVRDMAKILKQNGVDTGEVRLFKWLRSHGYLISKFGRDYNSPSQKSMDLGIMEIKETAISRTAGTETKKTPLINGKGQQYFINKFLNKEDSNKNV